MVIDYSETASEIKPSTDGANSGAFVVDPDLEWLVTAWPLLPDSIRDSIRKMLADSGFPSPQEANMDSAFRPAVR